jgi:hypothetical protein
MSNSPSQQGRRSDPRQTTTGSDQAETSALALPKVDKGREEGRVAAHYAFRVRMTMLSQELSTSGSVSVFAGSPYTVPTGERAAFELLARTTCGSNGFTRELSLRESVAFGEYFQTLARESPLRSLFVEVLPLLTPMSLMNVLFAFPHQDAEKLPVLCSFFEAMVTHPEVSKAPGVLVQCLPYLCFALAQPADILSKKLLDCGEDLGTILKSIQHRLDLTRSRCALLERVQVVTSEPRELFLALYEILSRGVSGSAQQLAESISVLKNAPKGFLSSTLESDPPAVATLAVRLLFRPSNSEQLDETASTLRGLLHKRLLSREPMIARALSHSLTEEISSKEVSRHRKQMWAKELSQVVEHFARVLRDAGDAAAHHALLAVVAARPVEIHLRQAVFAGAEPAHLAEHSLRGPFVGHVVRECVSNCGLDGASNDRCVSALRLAAEQFTLKERQRIFRDDNVALAALGRLKPAFTKSRYKVDNASTFEPSGPIIRALKIFAESAPKVSQGDSLARLLPVDEK